MPTSLKACPFCGAPVEFNYTNWDEETQTGDDGLGMIECTGCRMHFTAPYGDRDSTEEAWNRRASP